MDLRQIPFKKMNGLGNDFVIIDARAEPFRLSEAEAGRIADRQTGAGCDQVIVLEPSRSADVFMRILNADGSEAGACGNATRCVATLLGPESGLREISIETASGISRAKVAQGGIVTADMGVPRFLWHEIPLARPCGDTRAIDFSHPLADGRVLASPSVVNVGNPHCIFWVSDPESYDLASIGAELEHDPLFPERANISLAEIVGIFSLTPPLARQGRGGNGVPSSLAGEGQDEGSLLSRIKLRVWERGAGLTRACGTAACAAAVAAARSGRTGREVDVALPGGVLTIEWRLSDDHILMTGPTEFEFGGILCLNGERLSIERASS
jgi:diaminopimelate epimerase